MEFLSKHWPWILAVGIPSVWGVFVLYVKKFGSDKMRERVAWIGVMYRRHVLRKD